MKYFFIAISIFTISVLNFKGSVNNNVSSNSPLAGILNISNASSEDCDDDSGCCNSLSGCCTWYNCDGTVDYECDGDWA